MSQKKNVEGAVRELNPRPLAPVARIIPLDQRPAMEGRAESFYADAWGPAAQNTVLCPQLVGPHGLMDKAHPS